MADVTKYSPTVAWRTLTRRVKCIQAQTDVQLGLYEFLTHVVDTQEVGAGQIEAGFYFMDFVGTPYLVLAYGEGAALVEDSFRTGRCPISGRVGIVYKSVGVGDSPYLAPVWYQFLHPKALQNSKRYEIDILWKKLYDETYVTDPAKWLRNTFATVLEFGVAIGQDNLIEGERSFAVGQGHETKSFMETILGAYALVATGQTSDDWISTDFLLTLGNGTDTNNRSNALEIYKSGITKIYNSLLIGAYSNGAIDPVDGMLQYTALDGLQIWDTDAWTGIGGGTDEKVKYDAGDTTAGYLSEKVVGGTNITLSEGTGADENKVKISVSGLAAVATSNSYDDLDDKPTIPGGDNSYLGLSDTSDTAYTGKNMYVPMVDETNSELDLVESILATFLLLDDTPSSYSGQGSKIVKVNSGATALEFGTASGNETTTSLGALIGSAGDATPNDTDYVATALTAGGLLKKITWTNVKTFLNTYFDTKYIKNQSASEQATSSFWISGVAKAATAKFGGATHYTEFEADGTIKFNGDATVFNDLVVPLTSSKLGANNKPDFDETNVGYLFPQNDPSEILYLVVQLPHGYKEGSDIFPHIHYKRTSAGKPTFKITYSWFNIGAAASAPGTTVELATEVQTYTSGDIHQINKTASAISGSGKTISSILVIKIFRDDNTVTGDVLAYQFDIHYQLDSIGSHTEYTK